MTFEFRAEAVDGTLSVVRIIAADRAAAVAELRSRELTPKGGRIVPDAESAKDDDEEDEDEEDNYGEDDVGEGPPRKAYRLRSTINVGNVLGWTLMWILIMCFTLCMAAPFFGYFYVKFIIDNIRIEECDPIPTRRRR